MIQPPYTTGTATVTAGSAVVTGTTTAWSLGLVAGGLFTRQGLAVPIISVENNTSLTLAYPWPGATESGPYAIELGRADAASAIVANRRLADVLSGLAAMSPLGSDLVGREDAAAMRSVLEALSFADGAVKTTNLANSATTNAKLADMAVGTVKMRRPGTGSGLPVDATIAQLVGDLGFSNSFAGNGWARSPGGLLLQWGLSSDGANADYAVPFPTVFSSVLAVVASVSQASQSAVYLYGVSADTITINNFAIRKKRAVNGGVVERTTDGIGVRWIAVGT